MSYGNQTTEENTARADFGFVQKGDTAKVTRGRKVPLGTVGVIIWKGHGQYGTRVGLKVVETGVVYWTAASNVVTVSRAAASTFVTPLGKGAEVTVRTADGLKRATIFWAGEDRKSPGKARYGVKFCHDRRGQGVFIGEDEVENHPAAETVAALRDAYAAAE